MKITDNIEITNEDNMLLMARYPDNYFDLAIVDPPYGIERGGQTETFTKNPKHKRKLHQQKDWDNSIPTKDYFNELFRVSKNQIIWGANYFVKHLNHSSMGWIFWFKGQEGLTMSDGEIAYSSFQKATRQININRGLIAQKGGSIHPTQKPEKLYRWLLENYAKEGDKILDTHLGSGSIAIACHDYKFDLTACELDKEYYDAAVKRITNHVGQTKLF
ncbi:methyltransferase [Flavobacterium phage 11b]|uniref:methyltransferase n=1 Tax=Flavobacterium phage 11b TaxID=294631 RepID=UPI000044415F|nr:methyltransferase [Flavobacterium phage 11b]CAH56692.1 modification methylase [Flavobacterium phage 11b]